MNFNIFSLDNGGDVFCAIVACIPTLTGQGTRGA